MFNDKLYYYSGSADKPPGGGIHEHVADPSQYENLTEIKNWRQCLSNFHTAEFELDGLIGTQLNITFKAGK
jgi:hypothetical protein